jgi:hypothetical protein
MARIRPNDIFDHFNPQLRAALDEAVDKTLPDIDIDRRELYRAFRRALSTKLKPWESVPSSAVDAD